MKSDVNKLPIPAFLLIGIGIGIFIEQIVAMTLIGLGTGIFISFLMSKKK